jgi:hypothetical protein
MYTVYSTTAQSLACDLLEITPAADKPCVLHAIFMSNIGGTADAGDAQEEMIQVGILVGASATNGGAIITTAQPVNRIGTTAAGFVARGATTNTTVASSSVLHAEGWNVRVPYAYIPTPEMRPVLNSAAGSLRMTFRIMTALATDTMALAVTAYIEEI